MASLLFAFLQLLGLALVVRLTLPTRYVLLNPYAAACDTLLGRLIRLVRTAIPLPDKPLCVVLLGLDLSACAALLTRLGGPELVLGGFAVATYPARGFLGGLGVEVLRFAGFNIALLAGVAFLRLWHLGRPLPGYTGDLLRVACNPFMRLPLWGQVGGVAALAVAYVGIALAFASEVAYPAAEVFARLAETLPGVGVASNLFDLSAFPLPLRAFFLAGMTVIDVIGSLGYYIFLLLLMALVAALLGSQPMVFFLNDALRLLTGPIPPLRLGPIDFAPLVALLALGALESVLGMGLLFLTHGVAHVV